MAKQPHEFARHKGDGKRFHVRTYNGGAWEVYGCGLDHICDCDTQEMADMIQVCLEAIADASESVSLTREHL